MPSPIDNKNLSGNPEAAPETRTPDERALDERALDERALDERALLRTLIDSLPDSIFIKDAQSRFLLVNAAAVRLLRLSRPEEAVGKTDFDFYPPDLADRFYADERRIVQSGRPQINQEEAIVDAAGDRHWFLTSKVPVFDSDGSVIEIVGVSRDITERKRMEAALEQRVAARTAALARANTRLKAELSERRQAEESLARVAQSARCILWHAVVTRTDDPHAPFDWQIAISNEDAALEFFPIALAPGKTYMEAWAES